MIGNSWHRLAAAAACASLVGVAACGGRNDNGNDTTASTASGDVARPDSAATAASPSATTPASGTGATSSSSTMSITGGDAEILQVLAVVDQGEIQDGQMAQRQARNAQVKSFARTLVSEHTKSLQQDRSLAKTVNADLSGVLKSGTSGTAAKAGSTSTGSDTSKSASGTSATGATGVAGQLMSTHTQMMEQLRTMKGAAFDSAFVNAQVTGHQQVLDLLQRSQSQAQNSGVQQHVTAAIKAVQDHLDRGQKLQQTLASGAAGTSDSTSKSKTGTDTSKKGG